MKQEHYILIALTLVGAFFRFVDLTANPLWVDEGLFAFWVRDNTAMQEFLPLWIAQALSLDGESLRYISAVAGTLTIPAIYFALKGKGSIYAAATVAVFPLFVFWSKMARPYALAGLLVVMGWRWWLFYVPAMLTTPISLLGMRLTKDRWIYAAAFIALAAGAFLIRADAGRDFWNVNTILSSSRWFYIPLLSVVLHATYYLEKKL